MSLRRAGQAAAMTVQVTQSARSNADSASLSLGHSFFTTIRQW